MNSSSDPDFRKKIIELEQHINELCGIEEEYTKLVAERDRSTVYFQSLIENSSAITLTMDAQGVITYINSSVQQTLGYTPQELLQKNCYELIHADDVSRVRSALQNIMRHICAARPVELRVRHKDGSWRVLDGVAKNLPENEVASGVVINSCDITDIKEQQHENFQKLIIQRELRMVELKDKIVKLQAEKEEMLEQDIQIKDDIRNRLQVIRAVLEELTVGKQPPQKWINISVEDIERIVSILDDVEGDVNKST